MSHRLQRFVHALLFATSLSVVAFWQAGELRAGMLYNGEYLTNGQAVWSDNGDYYLTYGEIGGWWGLKSNMGCWMLWTSGTDAYNACGYGSHRNQWANAGSGGYAVVQDDGNFVSWLFTSLK